MDPFGVNEMPPEDSPLTESLSLMGSSEAGDNSNTGEGDERGWVGPGDDVLSDLLNDNRDTLATDASPSGLTEELRAQGWAAVDAALVGNQDTPPSDPSRQDPPPCVSPNWNPHHPSPDAPAPTSPSECSSALQKTSSLAPLDDANSGSKLKRKRSSDSTAPKKELTGRSLKNRLAWAAKGIEIRRRRRQADAKRCEMVSMASTSATDPLPPRTEHSNQAPSTSVSQKYGNPTVLKLDDPAVDKQKADLRTYSTEPGWICDAQKGQPKERKVPTLDEMKARGFQVVSFLPTERLVGLDEGDHIIVALTGHPNDPAWKKTVVKCGQRMAKAGAMSRVGPSQGSRGSIAVLTGGCTHYNGTQKPSNRTSGGVSYQKAVTFLRNDPDINRVAAHQSALLGFYAPKEALYYDITLDKLYRHDRTLRRPFKKSIYPSVAFNVDPNTVTLDHTDAGNYPVNLCAITALGNYDHTTGGHIILYDLRLVIEFPVGYTFLIPSGAMRHGNTAIAEGETRYSIVQYCPGGLLRWVEHGFQNETAFERSGGQNPSADTRWEQVLNKLSRLGELAKDHKMYRRGH